MFVWGNPGPMGQRLGLRYRLQSMYPSFLRSRHELPTKNPKYAKYSDTSYNLHMRKFSLAESRKLGADLEKALTKMGLSTQSSISGATGIDQGQISRILKGDFKFLKGNALMICKLSGLKYADNGIGMAAQGQPFEKQDSRSLVVDAFERVWDGSPQHAEAIGEFISATGSLIGRWRNGGAGNDHG